MKLPELEPVFIVFDGPPGPKAPGFIEVETSAGFSVKAGEWCPYGDYWTLGPLVALSDANATIAEAYAQGKKDALLNAAKVVELFDDATMQNDYMIDSGDCAEILLALAAAPKQEKT